MSESPRYDEPPERATANARAGARAGKRAGHAFLVGVAVVFIASSATQIIPAVFGLRMGPVVPSPAAAAPPSGESSAVTCNRGVRALVAALDRASARAWESSGSSGSTSTGADDERTPRDFLQEYERAEAAELKAHPGLEQACAASTEGLEAWAALLRWRRAEEQLLLRDRVELAALRRDLAAHLAADLR